MSRRKYTNGRSNPGYRKVVVGSGIADRAVGAASVARSVVVIDNVQPVDTIGTALNVPSVKPVADKAQHTGFIPTIISNKQDRALDRKEKYFDSSYYNDTDSLPMNDNELAKLNNASVAPVEVALTMKPLNVAEFVEDTDLSTHSQISGSALIDMIYGILTGNTGCSVSKFTTTAVADYPNAISIGGNLKVGEVVRVTMPAGNVMPLTAADTDSLSQTDSDAALQACVKFKAMIEKLQQYYAKFPATLYLNNVNIGGVLTYNFNTNEIWFVLPVTTDATQTFNSSTWKYDLTISSKNLKSYEGDFIPESGDRIQEISSLTPGLGKYSNANIASAKAAVNFKSIAIARNDTINPAYTMPLVKLEAMIRRNTLLAAVAQVTVNSVRALQNLAETTEPFWPGWYNSIGAYVRSKKEDIDARVAGLQTNLSQVRVMPSVYSDIVAAMKIGMSPLATEGQLKVIVPFNASMPATIMVKNILTNCFTGDTSYTLGASTFVERLKTTMAHYTYAQYSSAIDDLILYISYLATLLKCDSIMTLNSATACYSVLSDAPALEYFDLNANMTIISKHNAKQSSYRQIFSHRSAYKNWPSGGAQSFMHISQKTTAHGVELDTFKIDLPTTTSVSSANYSKVIAYDVRHDAQFSSTKRVTFGQYNGTAEPSIVEIGGNKQATVKPDIAVQYEVARTDGNDVADYDTLCLGGFAVYMQHSRNYDAASGKEFIKYFRNQMAWSILSSRMEPYAAYLNSYLYNYDETWEGVTPEVPGQYSVIDVPTYCDTKIVTHANPDHSLSYYRYVWCFAGADTDAFYTNKVECFNFWKTLSSGFMLTVGSAVDQYVYQGNINAVTGYNETITIFKKAMVPISVLLNDYAAAGMMRAYNGGSFDTMKYQYASHYSLLYLAQ